MGKCGCAEAEEEEDEDKAPPVTLQLPPPHLLSETDGSRHHVTSPGRELTDVEGTA